jgi:hypothetical protein
MKRAHTKRNLIYAPHLVTYIDIMGFRDMVADKSPNYISKVIRLVKEAFEPDKRLKKTYEESYVNFSDLIVHTIPLKSKANIQHRSGLVFYRILDIVHGQAKLIDDGIVVRGALTVGGMEKSYNVLFGPALISAYDLERKSARFPLIVVDPTLLREFKINPLLQLTNYEHDAEYVWQYLRKDAEGFTFVDYLGGLVHEIDPADYIDFLRRHKSFVEHSLLEFKSNAPVFAKYKWLKDYHNEIVHERIAEPVRRTLIIE